MLPRVAGLATLLACSPLFLRAQEGTASLACILQTREGAALLGGSVLLEGDFEFESLRPGRYSVNAGQLGFFPLSTQVDVAGGLESFYSFRLTPCPNGDCTVKPDPNPKTVVCE